MCAAPQASILRKGLPCSTLSGSFLLTPMMSALKRTALIVSTASTSALIFGARAFAQFGGDIPDLEGTAESTDVRETVTSVLRYVLSFLALIAVVIIVIAGIRLIVSQGNEEERDKSKKTILYAVIGLLIVLFARVIVGFFTSQIIEDGVIQ